MVKVLCTHESHRYLGHVLSLSPEYRYQHELQNRLWQVWFAFHDHKHKFLGHDVLVQLRLKLFDTYASSTIVFDLSTPPVLQFQFNELDLLQYIILRHIVGWRRTTNEPWNDTTRRMNQRPTQEIINITVDIDPWYSQKINGTTFRIYSTDTLYSGQENYWRLISHIIMIHLQLFIHIGILDAHIYDGTIVSENSVVVDSQISLIYTDLKS